VHLSVFWTSSQFLLLVPDCTLECVPVQGGNMNEFGSWTQDNWYGLGTLLTQLAFLIAGVWFARNFLKTIRAFQEQIGALLKLSITATPAGRHLWSGPIKQTLAESSPYWLTPSETETARPPEPISSGPNRLVVAWHSVVVWLQAPMITSDVGPWTRVVRWLQSPAGS